MKLSIIGGTGPQGKGLALRFAMAGFEVALGSRDKARAIEVAHSLSSENPNLLGSISGLSNSDAIAVTDKFVIFSVPWTGQCRYWCRRTTPNKKRAGNERCMGKSIIRDRTCFL